MPYLTIPSVGVVMLARRVRAGLVAFLSPSEKFFYESPPSCPSCNSPVAFITMDSGGNEEFKGKQQATRDSVRRLGSQDATTSGNSGALIEEFEELEKIFGKEQSVARRQCNRKPYHTVTAKTFPISFPSRSLR